MYELEKAIDRMGKYGNSICKPGSPSAEIAQDPVSV